MRKILADREIDIKKIRLMLFKNYNSILKSKKINKNLIYLYLFYIFI
jgi:hypothetical protein